MKKKNMLFVFSAFIGLIMGGSIVALNNSGNTISQTSATEECAYHYGYHYHAKTPTIDQSGHLEFWTCCVCNHQYTVEPVGDFITQDDSLMIGGMSSGHIAYLPPLTYGGSSGDYWTNDPFEE